MMLNFNCIYLLKGLKTVLQTYPDICPTRHMFGCSAWKTLLSNWKGDVTIRFSGGWGHTYVVDVHRTGLICCPGH